MEWNVLFLATRFAGGILKIACSAADGEVLRVPVIMGARFRL